MADLLPNFNFGPIETAGRADTARALKIGLAAIAVFNALLAAALLWPSLTHHVRITVDNLAQCLGPLAAFLFSLKGLHKKAGGRGWWSALCLGLGALGYVVGQAIWSYYELALNRPTPFPSWADAGFLAAYPFLFLGILTLPSRRIPTAARLRALFESLMLMVALVAFSWFYVLGPTIMQSGESVLARIIGAAYPLCDLVLLASVLLLFARARDGGLRALAIVLCAALGAIIASDTVFAYQTLHNTYATGHMIDLGWTLGYMLVGLAARMTRSVPAESAQPQPAQKRPAVSAREVAAWIRCLPAHATAFLPYTVVPAVGALAWHTMIARSDWRLAAGVFVCIALLLILILARQFLVVLQNQRLAIQLRLFNENLEREVAERTEQLAALLRLTAAVNETLVLEQVVSAAAWHSQQVLQADAAVMWLDESEAGTISYPAIVRRCGMEDNPHLVSCLGAVAAQGDTGECRLPADLSQAWEPGQADGAHYLQASLHWQGLALGRLGVVRRERGFDSSERELLHSIAIQVATALENARQFYAACEAADRDPITGLWNHRSINQYLSVALDVASAQGEPVSVIMTDIDNFKLLNDTYGHNAGDQVLQRIAHILVEECCGADRVGRYGGDEFLIVLSPGKTDEDGLSMAQRLRDRIGRETFQYSQDERSIPLALSFGVASFPKDSSDRQDLLRTADSNLTAAKSSDERVVTLTEMQRSYRQMRADSSFNILDSLVTAVDNKDHYTRRHSEDVTTYALWIAEELGLPEESAQTLRVGGLLHDVGKIGVPDEILRKPGKLTDNEYETLKHHAALGGFIVAGVPGMESYVDIVRRHHERWDGKGYPDGLAEEATPLLARIMAVADAVSAMTTDRPYRKGLTWETCLAEVERCAGTQFDPAFAAAFLRAARRNLADRLAPADSLKAA